MPNVSNFDELFKRALSSLQLNQFEHAIEIFNETLKLQPKHFDSLQLIASCYANLRDYELSIQYFNEAIAISKKNPKVFNNYGFVLAQTGETSLALKMYERALKLDSTYLDALNNTANLYQQIGEFKKSIDIYTRINKIDSSYLQAFFNKGVALQNLQQFELAIKSYNEALRIKSDYFDASFNKASCLKELRLFDESLAIYKELLLRPGFESSVDLLNNCGNLLQAMQIFEDALQLFDRAVMADPYKSITYLNRGNALQRMNRYEEGLKSYDFAIGLDRTNPDFYNNRGNLYQKMGIKDSAMSDYNHALCIAPNHVQTYYNKANLYKESGSILLAHKTYEQCLKIEPNYADAHNNLGNLFKVSGQFSLALNSYNNALKANPTHTEAMVNKGVALQHNLDLEGALDCFNKAINLESDNLKALINKAIILLLKGDFITAWPLYEKRLLDSEFVPKPLLTHKPNLIETDIRTRINLSALLWSEQGVGDEVMFASTFRALQSSVKKLSVKVDPRLIGLFKRSFLNIDFYSKEEEINEDLYDAHLPMGSLGYLFNLNSTNTIAVDSNYLIADTQKSATLFESIIQAFIKSEKGGIISSGKPLICGLSWNSTNPKNGTSRSIRLEDLIDTLNLPGVVLVNLQYPTDDFDSPKKQSLNESGSLITTEVDVFSDLDGFASLINACDLVISIDNSTSHFSAALGKPTWIMLPYSPDWRWMLESNKSYWYSSASLFRQLSPGEWSTTLKTLQSALKELINLRTKG